MGVLDELVPKLAELPGVVAVVLGGSRAAGTHRPDSDWDIGVYYRNSFDASLLVELGYAGHAAHPGVAGWMHSLLDPPRLGELDAHLPDQNA